MYIDNKKCLNYNYNCRKQKNIGGKTYECKGKERNNPSCINSNDNCEISFLRQETPLIEKRIERL